jgi:hypothetical protein
VSAAGLPAVPAIFKADYDKRSMTSFDSPAAGDVTSTTTRWASSVIEELRWWRDECK